MKLLHTVKTGKVNEIPLEQIRFSTRHVQKHGQVNHEGWAVTGTFTEKEHTYVVLFSPQEAREFHTWLGKMLERFDTDDLSTIITTTEHTE